MSRASWTPERRDRAAEQARRQWREQYPERAAVRDEIVASHEQEPCGRCGSPDSVLFVTDYEVRSFVWRCRSCAAVERGARRVTAGPEL